MRIKQENEENFIAKIRYKREQEEKLFLNSVSETFRVRRVILLGNNTPVVYAKSVIP